MTTKIRNISSSFCAWRIIKNIYLSCNTNEDYTIQKLATITGNSRYNPIFNSTIKYLMDNNIIVVARVEGVTKIIRVNTDIMAEIIEKSEFYEEVSEYIRKTRLIYANI